jgi:uncharacterized cupredoxin-like copper-binding protein
MFLKLFIKTFLIYFSIVFFLISQDLTRQKPIEKTLNLKGISGKLHYYEPNELTFHTGKLYKLIIKNSSDDKHYFSSNSFSKAIFTRKIQINSDSKKLAEIKGTINEIEVWPNNQIEWWFVPLKTGHFKDLFCRVKDKKIGIPHHEMGMIGTITIK